MSTQDQRERAERDAKLFHDAWLALKTGYPSTADYWLAAEVATIERCAKIADENGTEDGYLISKDIRALLPKEES